MFDENALNGIEDLTETFVVGGELTDEELSLVAGGMAPIYIGKTYFEGEGWVPDWLPE